MLQLSMEAFRRIFLVERKKFFLREETEELAGEEQIFNKQFLMVVSSESDNVNLGPEREIR